MTPGIKKWYETIPLFNVSIQPKRLKLLKDPDVKELLEQCYVAGGLDRISNTSHTFEEFYNLLLKSYNH